MIERRSRFFRSMWRGCLIAFAVGVVLSICIGTGLSLYQGALPPVNFIEGLLYIPLAGIYTIILAFPIIIIVSWYRSRQ